jgi:general secretion pathway protein G
MKTKDCTRQTQATSERKNRTRGTSDEGFTLVELLVVLVIIGLLAGLVAPRVLGYLGEAKHDSAAVQIKNIESALELYFIDNGQYPTTEQGLAALSAAPESSPAWSGPYLKNADTLKDPWGNAFVYAPDSDHTSFSVRSLGRDAREGGEGEDRDLP